MLGLYSSGELIVASSTLLPGDFNRDGHVDARDIGPMMQALPNLSTYQSSHGNISTAQVDLIGDGKFNNADLQALLNALESGGGSTDPVLEPASIVLLSLVALAITLRWRTR
jgi:Dockerin type I domain